MSTTLTIRADQALRTALEQRATDEGKTLSALIREILAASVIEQHLSDQVEHLQGKLHLRQGGQDAWRQRLRDHNWRS